MTIFPIPLVVRRQMRSYFEKACCNQICLFYDAAVQKLRLPATVEYELTMDDGCVFLEDDEITDESIVGGKLLLLRCKETEMSAEQATPTEATPEPDVWTLQLERPPTAETQTADNVWTLQLERPPTGETQTADTECMYSHH